MSTNCRRYNYKADFPQFTDEDRNAKHQVVETNSLVGRRILIKVIWLLCKTSTTIYRTVSYSVSNDIALPIANYVGGNNGFVVARLCKLRR